CEEKINRLLLFADSIMKNIDIKIFPLIFLLFSLHLAKGDVRCSNPSAYINRFGGRDQQCVALVQGLCHRSNGRFIGLTQSWRRGRHVRSNCDKYRHTQRSQHFWVLIIISMLQLEQHAAIFRGCTKEGIWF
ncbi:hypothetical protein SSS_09720, partial [Sarcoptes scabiei]